jgi:nucleotide-binding universal stress UspA family protein
MKILLPIYSMADAPLIVDFVSKYQWPADSSFKVIHVLGKIDTEAEYLEAEADASNLLNDVIARLKLALPLAEMCAEVISGEPTYEIITTASKWKAAMIVLGYRVRTDIQGVLAGSVSKGVAMQAPCSVAIIRPFLDENGG